MAKKQTKSKGKGIKGYLIGGDITDQTTTKDPNYIKTDNSFGNQMKGIGLAAADLGIGLATVGVGRNVIKQDQYNTSKIGRTLGEGNAMKESLDSFSPESKLLSPMIGDNKTGYTANQQTAYDTAQPVGKLGSSIGEMWAGKGLGSVGKTAANTVANVPTSTSTSPSMALNEDQQAQYDAASTQADKDALMNSWSAAGMKKGGTISPEKAKIILHEGMIGGKKITDKQRKFFGAMSNMADGGEVSYSAKKAAAGKDIGKKGKNFEKIAESAAKEYGSKEAGERVAGSILAKLRGHETGGEIKGEGTGTSDSIPATLESGGFIAIAKKKSEAKAIREKYLGAPKSEIASLSKGDTEVNVSDGETYFTEDEKKHIIANGGKDELNSLAPNAEVKAKGLAGKYATGGGIFDTNPPNMTDEERKRLIAESNLSVSNEPTTPNPYANDLELSKYLTSTLGTQTGVVPPVTTTTPTPVIEQPAKKNWFDPVAAIGAGQLGLGLAQSQELGKRPIDTINPETASSLARAKQDATYGFTPQEEAKLNRDIELNRRNDVRNIVSLSGSDAGTALGNIRAAGIGANEAKKNMSITGAQLQREKQRYADTRGDVLAGASKQLFNEKLGAFNTDQQAVAGLTGAGLSNLVQGGRDTQRYKNELEAQKLRNSGYASANPIDKTAWTKSQVKALAGSSATQAELDATAKRLGVNYNDLTA